MNIEKNRKISHAQSTLAMFTCTLTVIMGNVDDALKKIIPQASDSPFFLPFRSDTFWPLYIQSTYRTHSYLPEELELGIWNRKTSGRIQTSHKSMA